MFVRGYRPDMSGALEPEPLKYRSFNALFTRALRADARPADADPLHIGSPCDATLESASAAQADQLLQAKGHTYTLEALPVSYTHLDVYKRQNSDRIEAVGARSEPLA